MTDPVIDRPPLEGIAPVVRTDSSKLARGEDTNI
jgi:hypothetical protein